MTKQDLALLRDCLPPGAFLTGEAQLAAYSYDGASTRGRPEAVALPRSAEEVRRIVVVCRERRVPYVARGAGTNLSGGSVSSRGGVVLSLARLDRILAVDTAALTDLQGTPQFPGTEPWALEQLSYTNWDKYGKKGVKLLAGAGALMLYGVAVEAAALSSFLAGGATTGAVVIVDVIPVVAVVDIAVVAVMNHNNKVKVQEEFNRRRLSLPLTLPPGKSVAGSLFFPMTPGPQRLRLKGRSGDTPFELVLELKPLAGLHLKPAAAK